jgi:NAD(P)-dependent dehydrogenase (short-subunit alcohol dehydrogenase family)
LALGVKLDVVLHNAAVSLDPSPLVETAAGILDLSYEVNARISTHSEPISTTNLQTRGPLLVFQAMRPHLVAGGKFAVISSILGSIGAIKRGGKGAYGMSHVGFRH